MAVALTSTRADSRQELLRVLGLGFGLAVVVGGVVGQGIMRAPGIVARAFPNAELIVMLWVAGGVLAAVTSVPLIELATSVPRAGGPYTFVGRAFGSFAGTLTGWMDWLRGTVVVASFSVVFAEYAHRIGMLTTVPQGTLGVGLIATVTVLNWAGTSRCGWMQGLGSALKGIALIILIGALFAAPGRAAGAAPGLPPMLTLAALAIAMRLIQNTYEGWHVAAYFSEEVAAPERNIVRAILGGIALVTVLYVLINAAMLHVLTPAQMAASTLPAADAAGAAFGASADKALNALALLSVAASANLYPMYLSRIGYAMARSGVLPQCIARVSPGGTPRVALLLTTLTATALATSGSYEPLIAAIVPLSLSIDMATSASAIAMRVREPSLPRPFRMPLFPLPAIASLLLNGGLLVVVVREDPRDSLVGLIGVAVIATAYGAARLLTGSRQLQRHP